MTGMQFTRQATLSLEVLALCAAAAPNGMLNARKLAVLTDTSRDYVYQIVRELARHGYMACARGRSGGIGLARPASGIFVLDVLFDMEPGLSAGRQARPRTGCRVDIIAFDALLQKAWLAFLTAFHGVTIAHLVAEDATTRMPMVDVVIGQESNILSGARHPVREDARAVMRPCAS